MKRPWNVLAAASLLVSASAVSLSGCEDEDGDHDDDHEDAGAGRGGNGGGGSGKGGSGGGGGGGKSGNGGDGGGPLSVAIDFEARVGSAAFDCAESFTVGTGDTEVMPLDAKLYVHDIVMLSSDGDEALSLEQDGAFQNGEVALLDFEDDTGSCSNGTSQTHTRITGSVPDGEYTGLRFKIGVPKARNHVNQATAPSPLNIEGMFWSWTTGYKFLRIDVATMHGGMDAGASDEDAGPGHAGAPAGFNVHLGATMCAGDPSAGESVTCKNGNRPEVSFASFDPVTQKIVVDIAELLAGSNVAHDGGGAPGCMSGGTDPECPALFERLGLDLTTGTATGNPKFLAVDDK